MKYQKLVYDKEEVRILKVDSYFEQGVLKDYLFLELRLGLNTNKLFNERKNYHVLNLFRDVGGFTYFMILITYWIGEWFANRFMMQSLTNTLFLTKRKDNEEEEEMEGGGSYNPSMTESSAQPKRKINVVPRNELKVD